MIAVCDSCAAAAPGIVYTRMLEDRTLKVDLLALGLLVGFQREFINHGYYRQAAWYMDGDIAVGNNPQAFFFLCVQNTPPYESAVFNVDLSALDVGRESANRLFEKYTDCQSRAEWSRHVPGPPTLLTVPDWLVSRTFPEVEA